MFAVPWSIRVTGHAKPQEMGLRPPVVAIRWRLAPALNAGRGRAAVNWDCRSHRLNANPRTSVLTAGARSLLGHCQYSSLSTPDLASKLESGIDCAESYQKSEHDCSPFRAEQPEQLLLVPAIVLEWNPRPSARTRAGVSTNLRSLEGTIADLFSTS